MGKKITCKFNQILGQVNYCMHLDTVKHVRIDKSRHLHVPINSETNIYVTVKFILWIG